MIMREPLRPRLSWPARLGIALVGFVVLPAAPLQTNAQAPVQPPPAAGAPSDEEIAAAVELLEPGLPPRQREPGVDQPPLRDRRPDGPPPTDAGPRHRPQQQLPGLPGRGDGPRDPERRLQELEAKLDRIMQMLESRQGQPGPGMMPGGPTPAQPPGSPGGFPPLGNRFAPGDAGGTGFGAGATRGGPMVGPRSGGMGGMATGRPGRGPDGIDAMLRDLELSPEQREHIEHAQRDLQAEIQKIETEQARALQEFQRRREELERRRGEIIFQALSPEQRERMQQRGAAGERSRDRGERRPEERGVGRPDGRGGPDRPRDATEPRRERRLEPPAEGIRGRGVPSPDRPRDPNESGGGSAGEPPRDGREASSRPEAGAPE